MQDLCIAFLAALPDIDLIFIVYLLLNLGQVFVFPLPQNLGGPYLVHTLRIHVDQACAN